MIRSEKHPELLAPAGSVGALYAAIEAGADAVYLGGKHNARAYAENFDGEAMGDAIALAHRFRRKVYVTLNTLLYDRELEGFLAYARALYEWGADAAIVADLGALRLLHRELPGLPLHASTQAFVHNTAAADALAAMGVRRAVLARELSRESIASVTAASRIETEVFLHGALCVCHSGQCLFSSLVGGRSGNRGECAQPCRLPYNGGYPLSLRDLCLADRLPALSATGVASLKIEGRMKSPEYVYEVTRIYRRLLDEERAATPDEREALARVFSRDGFTDAYFCGQPTRPMTGTRSAEDKQRSREASAYQPTLPRLPLTAEAALTVGKPARLTLTDGTRSVTVLGEAPTPALTRPLTEEEVRERLARMGGTPFSLAPAALTLQIEGALFLPASALNALRRDAVAALLEAEKPSLPAHVPASVEPEPAPNPLPPRTAVCLRKESYRVCRDSGYFDRVLFPLMHPDALEEKPQGVLLPAVLPDGEEAEVRARLVALAAAGTRYAMLHHLGQLSLLADLPLTPLGSFRLNLCNREAVAAVRRAGIEDYVLSPELTLPQLRDLRGRVITYGRLPLMLTERCFIKENFGCARCDTAALTDRRGVKFPLMREYPHRNLILNSLPTYMQDKKAALRAAGIVAEEYLFTCESAAEAAAVLAAAESGRPLPFAVRRIPS